MCLSCSIKRWFDLDLTMGLKINLGQSLGICIWDKYCWSNLIGDVGEMLSLMSTSFPFRSWSFLLFAMIIFKYPGLNCRSDLLTRTKSSTEAKRQMLKNTYKRFVVQARCLSPLGLLGDLAVPLSMVLFYYASPFPGSSDYKHCWRKKPIIVILPVLRKSDYGLICPGLVKPWVKSC